MKLSNSLQISTVFLSLVIAQFSFADDQAVVAPPAPRITCHGEYNYDTEGFFSVALNAMGGEGHMLDHHNLQASLKINGSNEGRLSIMPEASDSTDKEFNSSVELKDGKVLSSFDDGNILAIEAVFPGEANRSESISVTKYNMVVTHWFDSDTYVGVFFVVSKNGQDVYAMGLNEGPVQKCR